MATETKSGRVVKTPGKFSVCVTGKRKSGKMKKVDIPIDDSATDFDSITSSMLVNTSQIDAQEEEEEEDVTLTSYVDITHDDVQESQTIMDESDEIPPR